MQRLLFIVPMFIVFFALNCTTLLKDQDVEVMLNMEKYDYILLKDINISGRSLKKGRNIKIIVTYTDDWVKVEAYPANVNKLKARRVRLLYLFEDDFKEGIFDVKVYEKKLLTIIKRK